MDLVGAYSNRSEQGQLLRTCLALSPNQAGVVRSRPRGKCNRLTEEAVFELCAEYRSGATVYELAAKFNIHRLTVSANLERSGVKRRMQSLTSAQIEDAVRLYRSGQSLSKVGEKLGCSAETVRQALIRIGEPVRRRNGNP